MAINRWGYEIKRGVRVICQHPRGGVRIGTVARVYRMSGYGLRIDLKEGGSFALDDAKPAPADEGTPK